MMDVGEGSFEEPELPQDPALILPDQLEFYAHIKVGFIEIYAFNLSSNIDYWVDMITRLNYLISSLLNLNVHLKGY